MEPDSKAVEREKVDEKRVHDNALPVLHIYIYSIHIHTHVYYIHIHTYTYIQYIYF